MRPALLALMLTAPPAIAQDAMPGDLALTLIFDHCLPYARQGATPFAGVASPPPPEMGAMDLVSSIFPGTETVLLVNGHDDHLAFWGKTNGLRFCVVLGPDDVNLGSLPAGPDFVQRADSRARDAGLILDMDQAAHDRRDARWREPQFADDPLLGLVLSVSIGPLGSDTPNVLALGVSAPSLLAQ